MTKFEIPILGYTQFDLSVLDFSDYDIKILDIESEDFEDYIKSLNSKFFKGNMSFFEIVKEEIVLYRNKRYAIVKNNSLDKFNMDEIYKVYHTLLILFPSNLQILYSVEFRVDKGFIQRRKLITYENKYDGEESDLQIENLSTSKISEINRLIKLIYPRLDYKNYIGLCFENYLNSFTASHLHFSFITLCMSLENLVPGPQELSYRLRRTAAILVGSTIEDSKQIFENLNVIYKLRSKIVHGEGYSSAEISNKMKYLQGFVSRIIIELLIHNVKNNKDLNEIITALGYGQRSLISKTWEFLN